MKKCISIIVVGLMVLCGIEAVALPADQIDSIAEKSGQRPCGMNTNTTFLTITYTSGLFGGITIKNVGDYEATNIQYSINITYEGFFKPCEVSGVGNRYLLLPGESIQMYWVGVTIFHVSLRMFIFWWRCPQGFGPITIETTAYAENAAPVTATAEGIILLHYVIIT